MLIVGERINSTREKIQEAIGKRDAAFIVKEASKQLAAGAAFIDVNCAMTSGDEVKDIDWVLSVLQSELADISISIDSPNYHAIDRAIKIYKAKGSLMINSITAEGSRIDSILPLALKAKAKLIALTMDDKGMPDTAEDRARIASAILDRVKKDGFDPKNLYFDPLIRPISTEPEQAREFLRSIPMIKDLGANTICGLSNVSFGLPNRKLINSTFLAMAVYAGLDAAILDPTDKLMNSSRIASLAIVGEDGYCADYIKAFRAGSLI
ncbi:MAG: dihydropteroate synthase [Candidatus Omnitrophica bacterium]|nr:dihydropteroate synthase [Candidatus Omnitrophota bacterium]